MKITICKKCDRGYVNFRSKSRKEQKVHHSGEVEGSRNMIIADFDSEGRLLGFEIVDNMSKVLLPEMLAQAKIKNCDDKEDDNAEAD